MSRKVRFAEVDAAGLLFYPRFFEYCHNALEQYYDEKSAFSYSAMIKNMQIGFPAVQLEGSFFHPLRHGDEAIVSVKLLKLSSRSLQTAYTIENKSDGVTSFQAKVTTVCLDLASKKAVEIPDKVASFLKGLE